MTRVALRSALSDQNALLATLFGEARSEPIEGQIAVACVVRNRAANPGWWGQDVRGVCLAKWQFSCWWEERVENTRKTYALAESLHTASIPVDEGTVLSQLLWVSSGVLGHMLLDRTGGADHYLTAAYYRDPAKCPTWARGRTPVAALGNHLFFHIGR